MIYLRLMLLTLCVFATILAHAGQSESPSVSPPYFHRKGHEIMDPDGSPFQIKGANVSCWMYQENYVIGGGQTAQKVTAARLKGLIGDQAYRQYLRRMMESFLQEEDVRRMKQMGINCVRLGFDAVLFEHDSTRAWFYQHMDRMMPVFREHDIAVLLIMMVPPAAPDKLWCTGYVKGDTMLWDSPAARRRTVKLWAEIAEHFRDERMILGYDLLGEPALPRKRERELISLYREISGAIRAVDPNHMIVYEGNNYAIDLDVLARYDSHLDANGCYSFHFYSWFGLKMEKHLPLFMKAARAHDRPVFCGEWGINRISVIKSQVNLMNRETDMDGWVIYMWKGLKLPTGSAEKKRPPYYGKWFFIPFDQLHMSLLTFRIDPETRDVIDWFSAVKKARQPGTEETARALDRITLSAHISRTEPDALLIETLGFRLPEEVK